MAPISIRLISLVLAFLVAAPVATKFINGYLLCDFTLTMYYEDLAIGIAMLVSCGIILLLASAINRDPKTTKGQCFRCVALALILTLLLACAACAYWSGLFNFINGTGSSHHARISNQTEFNEAQLDQWQSLKQIVDRKKHVYDKFADNENALCMDLLDFGWFWTGYIRRNDPLNLCANNNNDTIKAIFENDKATFQLTHRVDAIFKFAASVEWLAVFFAALAAFIAIQVIGSVEAGQVTLAELFTFGNFAAGHTTKQPTKNIPE